MALQYQESGKNVNLLKENNWELDKILTLNKKLIFDFINILKMI